VRFEKIQLTLFNWFNDDLPNSRDKPIEQLTNQFPRFESHCNVYLEKVLAQRGIIFTPTAVENLEPAQLGEFLVS